MIFFPIVCIGAILTLMFNGGNDTANSFATVYGSRILNMRNSILLCAFFEFLGATLFGDQITKTLGKDIIDMDTFDEDAISRGFALISMGVGIWTAIATYFKLPISITHSVVGGLMIWGINEGGYDVINHATFLKIILTWILSPFITSLLSAGLYFVIEKTIKGEIVQKHINMLVSFFTFLTVFIIAILVGKKGTSDIKSYVKRNELSYMMVSLIVSIVLGAFAQFKYKKADDFIKTKFNDMEYDQRIFTPLLLMTSCLLAFAHGGNDVGNGLSPFAVVYNIEKQNTFMIKDFDVDLWMIFFAASMFSLGIIIFGYRTLALVGNDIVSFTPRSAFIVQLGAVITIILATLWKMPVSTSQILIGSLFGVALMSQQLENVEKKTEWGIFIKIFITWICTIPATACIILFLQAFLIHL